MCGAYWHNRAGNGPDADPKIEAKFSAIVPQRINEAIVPLEGVRSAAAHMAPELAPRPEVDL